MKRQWHGSLFFVLFIFSWILFETPQNLFFQSQVHEAQAAIAIDNTSTGSGEGSTITVSHTTGSGSNRLMLVGISARRLSDPVGFPVVSGVTYNGVPLSTVGTYQNLNASFSPSAIWIYSLVAPATGTYDVVVSFSTLPTTWGAVVGVMTFTGVDPNTPLGTFASARGTSSTTATVDVTSATNELVFDTVAGNNAFTVGAGQTQRWNARYSTYEYGAGSTEPGASTVTMSWTMASSYWVIGAVSIKPCIFDQEGYRFRDDTQDETSDGADWLAAQDTIIARDKSLNTRLRVIVNTFNLDPATEQFQLEYKKSTDGTYNKVRAEGLSVPVAYGTAGDAAVGTTTLSVPYPASIVAGDLLVLTVADKYPPIGPSAPSGFSAPANNQGSGGMGSAGADSGNVYATIFVKEAVGTESGSLNVTCNLSANSCIGRMFRYTKGSGMAWSYDATYGSDNDNTGTTWSVTGASDPGIAGGDMVIVASAINSDETGSELSSEALSSTGVTYGAMNERQDSAASNGDDCRLVVTDHLVTSGTSSAAPVYTATTGTPSGNYPAGASVILRIRQVVAYGTTGSVDNTSTTSLSVPYPASIAAGDLLVLTIANQYPNWGPDTPAGWSAPANNQGSGGKGSDGADSGNVYATIFVKEAVGGDDAGGNLIVPIPGGTKAVANMFRYTRGSGKAWDYAATNGSDNDNSDTTWSVTGASDPGITSGDMVIVASAINSDETASALSSEALSSAGVTYGAMNERKDIAAVAGCRLVVSDHLVTGGTSSAAPVYTATTGTPSGNYPCGASVILRIRQVDAVIQLSLSGFFANGDPTTAQLTAPSGNSGFTAGKMQESTNPAATVNIGNNYYTEMEWCLTATTAAQYNDVYQFRVTANGIPFATYSVTPQWTILSSPTAVALTSFTAAEYPGGVLLRWKTGYEVNNLGFHVYREENGKRVRLTPEPVAGSALLAGPRTAMTAGHHYSWWDTSSLDTRPSTLATLRYWLKDIDLNGTHTMHGPVTPVFSKEPLPEKFRPELLSEIGMRLQERYRNYWKVQELKDKLRQKPSAIRHQPSLLFKRASNLKGRRPAPQGNSVPDPQTQQSLAGRPAVKLLVKEEGWYRVSQPELLAAGLTARINPQYLQLFVDGKEQPIRVIGGKDGRFGSRDAIEFYGVGLDTPSTDTRVYWLIEGTQPGKRIDNHIFNPPFRNPHSAIRNSFASYPYTIEKKDRTVYFAALKNGDAENFFGPIIYQSPVNELLEVRHHDPATMEDALLEVVLQGVTNVPHRVKVLLNEAAVGEVTFEGQSQGLFKVEVSQSGLIEGENLVSLVGQGGDMDISLLDSIRLTYWHTFTADEDSLKFTVQGGSELSIDGFSHPRVRVIDITDPDDLFEVFGRAKNRESGYAVTFRVPESGERTLLAFTEEKAKSPIEVFSDRPSFWHQERKGYDLIIISHRDFFDSLQPLKSLRESQGLKVALVDVEDLYDEFSFGNKSPKAIKDFLTLAKANWRKPPRFVLLVGDASFDPRNYLGLGDFDFVPTKLIDTVYLETASDDWFVDFNNDGLPEMAIGRLPVQTSDEASIVVSKIVGYEKSSKKNEALLVADRVDNSDDFNFEGASEELRALLPADMTIRKIFRGQFSSDAQAKRELLNGINQGALLVNFIGHGSTEIWRGSILTSDDAEALTNSLRLPFFISMTCLNGFFQDVYTKSLAEALLKAKLGGAVAVWSSSGLTEPDKQAVMNKELIRLLFGGEFLSLGEATMRAKASVSDQDIRKTWILFGDPTTRLRP